jgi:hypothetical protein
MNSDKSANKKTDGCWKLRATPTAAGAGSYLVRAVSSVLLLASFTAFATNEETLGVLQVGDHTYHDVTVRTKAKDYVFILHSTGLTSIKVTQLPNEVRQKLGYPAEAPALTPTRLANRGAALLERAEAQFLQGLRLIRSKLPQPGTYPKVVAVTAALLIAHVFCSFCCMLICLKTGINPGILVWFPALQAVPMLRAASMSTWWLGALFVPGVNVVGWVLWCVKIVRARQKTMPLAILLSFPLTSWFAFLFLAFSEDSRDRKTKVRVEAMTFQSVCSAAEPGLRALLQSEQHIVA